MRAILIILDGVGDRPIKELNNLTPLQYAYKRNLDLIAEQGICGLMDPIAPGIRPGSDTGHLSILGYDPYKYYTGRGPIEAVGAGLKINEGDLAFRGNFATVDEDFKVIDRRAGRICEGGSILSLLLDGMEIDGVKISVAPSVEHRCVVVFRADGDVEKFSSNISASDPHKTEIKVNKSMPLDNSSASRRTAKIVNKFSELSHEKLKDSPINRQRISRNKPPANIILLRGGGKVVKLEPLEEKNIKAACISGVDIVKGVCKLAGMDVIAVEGATGSKYTNLIGKADASIEALDDHNIVLLHIKMPDLYSHDHDPRGKVECIERIDSMIQYLLSIMPEDLLLCVTADHSTPIDVGDHSGDPVPIAIMGHGIRRDGVKKFDEISIIGGGLGRIRGVDLMNILSDLIDVSEKFGA